MKALIVYWSKYGNTKQVAEAIARGMKSAKSVKVIVKDVRSTDPEEVLDYDVLVIGSANHIGRPVGDIRKFLKKLAEINLEGKKGAVFDTHIKNDLKTVQKMEKQIREKITGLKLVIPGLATRVEGMKGPLCEGELPRAEEFGKSIVAEV